MTESSRRKLFLALCPVVLLHTGLTSANPTLLSDVAARGQGPDLGSLDTLESQKGIA